MPCLPLEVLTQQFWASALIYFFKLQRFYSQRILRPSKLMNEFIYPNFASETASKILPSSSLLFDLSRMLWSSSANGHRPDFDTAGLMLEYIGHFGTLSSWLFLTGERFFKVIYADPFHGQCLSLSSQNPWVKRTRIAFVVCP